MIDNGGPAFPVQESMVSNSATDVPASSGMSMLDYFAGQALTGLFANSELSIDCKTAARESYHAAEEMLAEKQRRDEK